MLHRWLAADCGYPEWQGGRPSGTPLGPLRAAQYQNTRLVANTSGDLSGVGTLASSGIGDGGKVTCRRSRRCLAMANFNLALICPGGSQVLSFCLSAAVLKNPVCKGPAGRFPSEFVAGPGTSYPALLSSTDSAPTHHTEVQLFSLLENADVYFNI